ncbi:MAG: sugar ABC transporter ATP-binding protein [Vicinamibacterales bacterium]
MSVLLQAVDLVKRFGGVHALNGVSLDLQAGEVHAICGENGAGKSTLIKLLAGVHPSGSYEGQLLLRGRPARFASPRDAERAGIAIVHQELALFGEMTVAENLFLTDLPRRRGRVDWPALHTRARAVLAEAHIELDPDTRVGSLSIAQQQLVEIARALARQPAILVLDEPTAALATHEVGVLLDIVGRLRARGVTCVYISHKLDEVFRVADRITVLRDGVARGTTRAADTTPDAIVSLMVGRPIGELFPVRSATMGEVVLSVKGLSVDRKPGAPLLRDLTFDVAAGEILGIGGLMGAGRSELLLHLMGCCGQRTSGTVHVDGQLTHIQGAQEAMDAGLALVCEDRKRLGLVLSLGVSFNLMLSSLKRRRRGPMVDADAEHAAARDIGEALRIKTSGFETPVSTLSGGNQQKVVLGKALLTKPRVLLLDEPTRGIDIGAKREIYKIMRRLSSEGTAIVMVSSEMPELIGMSDRILMLHDGRAAGVFTREHATEERLLAAAMGRGTHAA